VSNIKNLSEKGYYYSDLNKFIAFVPLYMWVIFQKRFLV